MAGVLIAALDFVAVCLIGLFDEGTLATDWVEKVPWLLLAAIPAGLGLLGLRKPPLLLGAGLITFPLAILSLATMPMIASAMCYLMGYGKSGPAAQIEV